MYDLAEALEQAEAYLLPTAARFMFDRRSRNTVITIARPAHSIDPMQVSVISYSLLHNAACHTQVCQIPPSAQVDALQIAAAEARAVSRGRAGEQVAYRQGGMYAARVATEVVKVAVRRRHGCGYFDARALAISSVGSCERSLGRWLGSDSSRAGWRLEL